MVVHPKVVTDLALDERLADLELDLYDIYFVAPDGTRAQITSPARVTLPVTGVVDGVYYIAPTGLAEALPFIQIDDNHVTVEVTHFSYYGVAYKPVSQPVVNQVASSQKGQSSPLGTTPQSVVAYGQSVYGGQAQPELTKVEPAQLPATGDAAAVFATATGLVSLMAGLGLATSKKED